VVGQLTAASADRVRAVVSSHGAGSHGRGAGGDLQRHRRRVRV
jgi:hypothetical protein